MAGFEKYKIQDYTMIIVTIIIDDADYNFV